MDMGLVSLSSHNLSCHKPDSVRERERREKNRRLKNERNKTKKQSLFVLPFVNCHHRETHPQLYKEYMTEYRETV